MDAQGNTARESSRYTLLLEKLASVEHAKRIHESMARRVLAMHDAKIRDTRAELEREKNRVSALVKAAQSA
jgi:hypothetical protein